MKLFNLFFLIFLTIHPVFLHGQSEDFDPGLQHLKNPPMVVQTRTPPPLPKPTEDFDMKPGFRLITTLDEFRSAIKKDSQKIRLKPGIYRATKADPPFKFPLKSSAKRHTKEYAQEHIFAVNGSDNFFDLRGVVFETPVSVQSKLTGQTHVSDNWHINGDDNVFVGGYFRNVIDYPIRVIVFRETSLK